MSDNNQLLRGELLHNVSLADYNTWRVGGIADSLYKPADLDDLADFLRQYPQNAPLTWLGLGSNALIRDSGIRGCVIVTQGALKNLSLLDDGMLRAEAGVSCATMARFSARNNLAGGEFWAGIPGTMGGALRMNAGCYGSETWNFVSSVETIDRQGNRRVRGKDDFEVAYRHVRLPEGEWFIAATFALTPGDKADSLQKIRELLDSRAKSQPTSEYNCGSVFRNPPGTYAAKLIESCGLKGTQHGGARVSEKHANFIINHAGQARARDIEELIARVRETVLKETSIAMIQEVHVLGEE